MGKRVLVTGGTGSLGRALVPQLLDAGHDVRVLSRRQRRDTDQRADWAIGDLRANKGLDAAVSQRDVIVHCATTPRGDVEASRNLIDAARRAGSPHLIYMSIVGVDRVPLGYYKTKLAVEGLVATSGLPYTILRATQFHDLLVKAFGAQRKLPVLLVPAHVEVQPIDVRDVAARLVELVGGEPAGRVPDIGGPRVVDDVALANAYLRHEGRRQRVVSVPVPGRIGDGYRAGGHLTPQHAEGHVTFEEFLDGKPRVA